MQKPLSLIAQMCRTLSHSSFSMRRDCEEGSSLTFFEYSMMKAKLSAVCIPGSLRKHTSKQAFQVQHWRECTFECPIQRKKLANCCPLPQSVRVCQFSFLLQDLPASATTPLKWRTTIPTGQWIYSQQNLYIHWMGGAQWFIETFPADFSFKAFSHRTDTSCFSINCLLFLLEDWYETMCIFAECRNETIV